MSAARKNSGTPIGTVMAIACATVPVSTPRRTLALLKANVAAEQMARSPPSTPCRPPDVFQRELVDRIERQRNAGAAMQIGCVVPGFRHSASTDARRRAYGSIRATDSIRATNSTHASPRREIGAFGHLGPLGDLVLEKTRQLLRRAADEAIAERNAARLDVGLRQDARHVAIDLGDYVARRALGGEERKPGGFLLHRHALLLEGRHLRQRFAARVARHRERPHLTGLHIAERAAERGKP